MLRKMVKDHEGRWVVAELSKEEVSEAVQKVREFNREAWRMCLEDAKHLFPDYPSDKQFEIAKILFDKLAMQSFSVLRSMADTIMV